MAKSELEKMRARREKERKKEERERARQMKADAQWQDQQKRGFWGKLKERFSQAQTQSSNGMTDRQRKLIRKHRIWRAINWTVVLWLANSAFGKVLDWTGLEHTGKLRVSVFVVSFTVAAIMVVFAEGTSHDKSRRWTGWIFTWISEGVMLGLPLLLQVVLEALNAVTRLIGGGFFDTEKFALGPLWLVNLVLMALVDISLLREEQSTDKNLAFARTPQKRDYKDIKRTTDESGNPMLQVVEYKK